MASLLLPTSEPSICIPRVFPNIDKTCVKDVFEELFGKGCIERIDMIQKKTGNSERFQRVFVHFKYWPVTQRNQQVRQRLIDGHQLKIVYSEPWFWKCSASRIPKPKDKVSHPYIDGKCETYDITGKNKGDEIGDATGDATGDTTRGATGDTTRGATGDTTRGATGDTTRGDDNKATETCWRRVDNKTRGKKNRHRDSSDKRPLWKGHASADLGMI
jgi:hypothetical protein